jgi:biopolymer transport protein ExbB
VLDVILETWSHGGIILLPLFLSGFWGFFLVFRTYGRLGRNLSRSELIPQFEEIKRRLEAGDEPAARRVAAEMPGIVGSGVKLYLDNRALPREAVRHLLEERLAHALFLMDKHIPLIKSLAAAAPLLGLLGTVSGLIHTFRAMTDFGTGNAQLLSRGISEALIAAQTGLLIAIILILLGQRLEGRVLWLKDQTEYGITLLLNLSPTASAPARGDAETH